jgi:hypothetical protein
MKPDFRRRSATLALLLALSSSTTIAAAQAADEVTPTPDATLGNHQRHVRLDIGVRTQLVRSAGLDPFSSNDVLPQLTLGASYYFWARDRFSVGGVFAFDYASASENARSAEASLDARRLLLGPELRYHVLRVLALTAKAGPTLTRQEVTYSGELVDPLQKTTWKAGVDATLGVACEVFGYASGQSNKPRLWLTAEGGYGYTAPNRLRLTLPDDSASPQRLAALDLGELSLSGPLFRATAALSFW